MADFAAMTTGMDLKVDRIRARVQQQDLARAMGVSRQRVAQVESWPKVHEAMEQRYRAALAQLADQAEVA